MSDFDFEPVPGLPERLPAGETMLWQGRPEWRTLARRRFPTRWIAAYFAVLALWAAQSSLADGGSVASALTLAGWLALLGAAAVAIVYGFAWLVGHTTIYTITSRRLVLRVGVALPMSLNIPFRTVAAADLQAHDNGEGDIALTLAPGEHIAWLHLWPHAQRWRLSNPRPTLLALPAAQEVAEKLARAVVACARERGDLAVSTGASEPQTAGGGLVLAQ